MSALDVERRPGRPTCPVPQTDIENRVGEPTAAYLERIEPDHNLARFYAFRIEPTLFGEWALICQWGRIGTTGQQHEQWWATHAAAVDALATRLARKQRRGYRIRAAI